MKKCKYCQKYPNDDNDFIFWKDNFNFGEFGKNGGADLYIGVSRKNGDYVLRDEIDVGLGCKSYDVKINYCPMCGRKLNGDPDNGL